jgi:hypothetical protein
MIKYATSGIYENLRMALDTLRGNKLRSVPDDLRSRCRRRGGDGYLFGDQWN